MYTSENKLVTELKKENVEAYEYLVDNYTKPVYYLAYNILKIGSTKEDIEECVSDVFLEVWQKIYTYDESRGSFRTWVLILTKYKALSYKRVNDKKNKVVDIDDYQVEDSAHVEKQIIDRQIQEELMNIINTFNNIDKEIFIRRYFYNESISNLVNSLGLTRSAVDNRLLRGRNKIKEAFQ